MAGICRFSMVDILEIKKTMPFIKKHLIKLQLKLEIQRDATNKY